MNGMRARIGGISPEMVNASVRLANDHQVFRRVHGHILVLIVFFGSFTDVVIDFFGWACHSTGVLLGLKLVVLVALQVIRQCNMVRFLTHF